MNKKIFLKILFLLIFILACQFFKAEVLANASVLPKAILIKGSGPKVYVLEKNRKRWIPNPEVFNLFSYEWDDINVISDISLGYYADADDLSQYDAYPEGSLVKGSGSEVYLIESGRRRWIPTPEIFNRHGFDWRYILKISNKNLNEIDSGDSVKWSEQDKYPNTLILEGPEEDSTIQTTEVSFKLSGTNPLGDIEELTFEVYLKGYDSGWRISYSDTATYNLPSENKSYTFYARARNEEGYTDLSPAWRDFSVNVSSYYGEVEFYSISYDEDDFRDDYLVIRNYGSERANITGWTITNKRNESITIPKAAAKLTYPYLDSYKTDIELDYGDELIVSSNDSSPINMDFRINDCTGYLDQSERFYPSLNKNCPAPDTEDYEDFKSTCRSFIDSLSVCEIPDYTEANFIVQADSQCTTYLSDTFNYKQCYADHNKEIGFFGDEWRVYFNKPSDFMGNIEDKLVLKDKNGFIIDEYSY